MKDNIYKKTKPELKRAFEDFIEHPDQYTDDRDIINAIEESNGIEHLALWQAYKGHAKKLIHDKGWEDFDNLLIEDLNDATVKPVNKAVLKLILKHPGAEEFNLEPETIKTIKNFSQKQKEEALASMSKALGFTEDLAEADTGDEIHDKILEVLSKFWNAASPVLSKVFGVLTGIGTKLLEGVVKDNVAGKLGDHLAEGVNLTGKVIEDSFYNESIPDGDVEAAGGD